MDRTSEKDAVVDTVTRLFINKDNRDWSKVKALFAPSVVFDMTSVAGGKPSIRTPEEIADGWDKGLQPLTRSKPGGSTMLWMSKKRKDSYNAKGRVFC